MKFIILIFIFLSIFQAQENIEQTGQCAQNPFLQKLRTYAQQLKEEFTELQKAETLLDKVNEIAESDGAILNLNDTQTDFCSEFDGQNSCCTQGFVDHLPFLIKSYVRRKHREARPKVKQFLTSVAKGVGKCGGRQLALKYLTGEKFLEAVEAIKSCNQKQIKAQAKFLIKNTCAICIGSDDLSTKFQDIETEQPKLKVSQESMDNYDESIKRQFKCQRRVFNIFENYTRMFLNNQLPETFICKKLKRNVINFLDGETMLPNIPTDCKNRAKVFSEGCLDDTEATDQQVNLDITTENAQFRFLQSSDSDFVVVSDSSAYNLYEVEAVSQGSSNENTGDSLEDTLVGEVEEEIIQQNEDNGISNDIEDEENLSQELDIVLNDLPEEGVLSPGDEGYVDENSMSQILYFSQIIMITFICIL